MNEQVDEAVGKLCIAIGQGKFRDAVALLIMQTISEAYERGRKYGKEQAKKKEGGK